LKNSPKAHLTFTIKRLHSRHNTSGHKNRQADGRFLDIMEGEGKWRAGIYAKTVKMLTLVGIAHHP
jgi:hypothetical protein